MGEERLTYADVGKCLETLERKMNEDGYTPDSIIAISRGGLVVGQDISHRLGTPLGVVKADHYNGTEQNEDVQIRGEMLGTVKPGNVLVVDDIADSGETLRAVVSYLKERITETDFRTAVLHKKPRASVTPDYCVETVEDVRYPWEINEDW